ncbi:MAG TPA: hypothetical protein VJ000_01890 [Thermodesulfovibrionia bacterium]|nr:hypothetical protein [Thermodesulfovibrionia bacterium]
MSSGFWFIKIYPDKQIQQLHPENKHIRPKIRQQLQLLRDKGILEFLRLRRMKRKMEV